MSLFLGLKFVSRYMLGLLTMEECGIPVRSQSACLKVNKAKHACNCPSEVSVSFNTGTVSQLDLAGCFSVFDTALFTPTFPLYLAVLS